MNKLKNLISIIIISLILISCASQPQYGMELKEVKYAIHQTCKVPSDMSVNITPENSMVYRGTDPLNPQIELFEFYGPTQYQGNPWYCDEPLYFFEKKLITKMERKELIESYQRKVNEQKKRLNEIEEERARAEEERRKLQEKNRVDKIVEKSKELLISNGAKIIYISGTFLIGSKGNQLVYMKEGRSVKPEEVNSEIVEYKNYLAYQRQLIAIREKNLSYRWVVQAQAVCNVAGYQCWITQIREEGRNEDGSAVFSIHYQRKRGTAGSSGSTSIVCGFNSPNKVSSTAVYAVCQ